MIARSGRFDDVFVTPAAGDSGVAVGAALLGHERVGGLPRRWAGFTDFLGRDHGSSSARAALSAAARSVTWSDLGAAAPHAAAEELAVGGVVAWFEGRSELGPRALGHRSILADPRGADLREQINRLVKFREPFRPYAAAILWPEAIGSFESVTEDPFMLTVATLSASARDTVPAVCHVDGTCRIQSVDRSQSDGFAGVLRHFAERTGVPMILNTSFNVRGEPIVETPADAIRCFLASNIETLFLNGIRVSKHRILDSEDPAALIPTTALLETWRTIRRRPRRVVRVGRSGADTDGPLGRTPRSRERDGHLDRRRANGAPDRRPARPSPLRRRGRVRSAAAWRARRVRDSTRGCVS